MRFVNKTKLVAMGGALALAVALAGCNQTPAADHQEVMFPQTSETIIVDPAHAPAADAKVTSVYVDNLYGKTEVRSDDYIRHADSVSPTGWTPWHYRTYPHNWSEPMKYETSVSGSWTAQVQAIDVSRRLIVLQGASGKSETFSVDKDVERLSEVNVGDKVTLAWRAMLQGTLRSATPEEMATPIKIYSLVNRASSDAAPAGVEGMAVRVVTTIDAIDLSTMAVTLKGPLGNRISVRAKSADNIKKLSVGDTVVVVYSQAVAVAVTKAP